MAKDEQAIWEELKNIIFRQNPGLKDLQLNHKLINDLHYDSLKTVELTFMIEDKFGIEIRGDDIGEASFATPAGLVALIRKRMENR